jgi:hypothetical protein
LVNFMTRFLYALLLALSPLCVFAAGAEFAVLKGASHPGETFELRVEDTWPNACTPAIDRVDVRGADIWIIARDTSEASLCGQRMTDYSLDTRQLIEGSPSLSATGLQRVYYAVKSSTGMRLRGFQLIAMGEDPVPAPAIESGYWWADPATPNAFAGRGIGINIERQGAILSAVLFGYNAEGDPEWSLGSGPLGPHFSRLAMSRLSKGAGPHAEYREPGELESLGSMLIEPASPSRARLWLAYVEPGTADLSLREIEIVRFGFVASPAGAWSNRWLLVGAVDSRGAAEARELSFVPTQGDREGFTLLDPEGKASLVCKLQATRADRIPDYCTLRIEGEETPETYMFDRIGLRSMQGIDAEERTVRLFLIDAE